MGQQTFDSDEVRLVMAAPPEKIYDVISDITRMREFSPEVVESRWLGSATGPAVGAKFKTKNRFSRGPAIGNTSIVTAVEPGRKISWSRKEPFGGTVEWTYEFRPHAEGTEVVESYRALVPVSRLGWVIISFFSSKERAKLQRKGMEETLERLRAHVESST